MAVFSTWKYLFLLLAFGYLTNMAAPNSQFPVYILSRARKFDVQDMAVALESPKGI
ncbi:hypothetical protein Csa_020554 [Cucumis sativus]|uniref:Uncharacterized protein n=1 Tax=Cucumis sativus TaxID=3659 RepID=A0A0A0K1Q8_CUCSA|nr:hypothetical protein Csa_020554 [Cucumis sativus]